MNPSLRRALTAIALEALNRLAGAPCPAGCGYISRGRRTLSDHLDTSTGCRVTNERGRQEEAR